MYLHVIQAHIQAPEHIREFWIANCVSGTRGIEPPRRWIQEVVVVKIGLYTICQLRISFLGLQEALALLLEVGRLRFHRFE